MASEPRKRDGRARGREGEKQRQEVRGHTSWSSSPWSSSTSSSMSSNSRFWFSWTGSREGSKGGKGEARSTERKSRQGKGRAGQGRARRAVALAVANGAKDLYPEWQLLAHGLATELLRLLQIPVLLGREQKGRQRR